MPPLSIHSTAIFLALTLTGCSTSEGPLPSVTSRSMATVSVGPQNMALVHQGRRTPGTPAIVLQSGLGKDHSVWTTVMDNLPQGVLTIAPDRPGYGASPQSSGARDACTIATEQRALLQRAGVAPPYLLVGHSLGGSYQYAFARMYPNEVSGLILLDPTHENLAPTMEREDPVVSSLLNVVSTVFFTNTMKQEFDAQSQCYDRLPSWNNAVPTMLLAPGKYPAYMGSGMQTMLTELRTDWTARTNARHVAVPQSGHDIPTQAPLAVVKAVEQMMASLRSSVTTNQHRP